MNLKPICKERRKERKFDEHVDPERGPSGHVDLAASMQITEPKHNRTIASHLKLPFIHSSIHLSIRSTLHTPG